MAVALAVHLTIALLILTSAQSIYIDNYYDSPQNNAFPSENLMDDETDYLPISQNDETLDYDWSPPNGELPENDFHSAKSLESYFNDEDGQPVVKSWFKEERTPVEDRPKNKIKRGFSLLKSKKNQVFCRVQRAVHHHSESGFDFFPKSYTSYSCHPVGPSQFEGSLSSNHDTCFISGNNCITIEKEQLFLKRKQNTHCWTHFIEAVGAGCKCLSRNYDI